MEKVCYFLRLYENMYFFFVIKKVYYSEKGIFHISTAYLLKSLCWIFCSFPRYTPLMVVFVVHKKNSLY
jgi:hypothetical protein